MNLSGSWPFPGEQPLARARRAALAYRAALELADPDAAGRLDEMFAGWGETWVTPRLVSYGPDDWLEANWAADILHCSAAQIHQLRRAGRLPGRQNSLGRWVYRAADVERLFTEPRRRERHARDTLSDDGRSAS